MSDVIDHDVFEGYRIVAPDADGGREAIGRDMQHQMQQVPVVGEPEIDQIAPFAILKPFRLDPLYLRVAWRREL